ncbi:hypothetical protein BJX65DRAFT_291785 [Aspergillus insuetus]
MLFSQIWQELRPVNHHFFTRMSEGSEKALQNHIFAPPHLRTNPRPSSPKSTHGRHKTTTT